MSVLICLFPKHLVLQSVVIQNQHLAVKDDKSLAVSHPLTFFDLSCHLQKENRDACKCREGMGSFLFRMLPVCNHFAKLPKMKDCPKENESQRRSELIFLTFLSRFIAESQSMNFEFRKQSVFFMCV